ncbi:DUF2213 domain-containing protein [Paraburkholderia sp. Ac-20342]|uniref:DUF2213 domain-containing protein n=1 Tax=Paraburkholderia sp. Ac-20342 TaxID=2703889 RepID=UPI001981DE0F|nr:DUF2213 domain-containing protein [Paraburkholderia sp. Ac-20342]MBN3848633.1 DUF2213 domain-containing protein [Paraburkholderia sp. Ac-20342]
MHRRYPTIDHACTCGAHPRKPTPTKDAITASGFFTNERIGPKRSLTPEGFLLCEDVPIARTGSQDYAYFELPELEAKDGVIVADRDADVLFSPETLASFEGKPVTIDHPPDFVTPANWKAVSVGHVRNVRRGERDQSELMLADLLITDAEAIRRVQSESFDALDQVSNGYDADYEQIAPGRARQAAIVGNHVALVKNARCGPVCSIGDSSPTLLPKGEPSMAAKKQTSTLLERMRKAFMTRDADAFEQVANEMTGDEGGEGSGQPAIHIHMPSAGATAGAAPTGDEDPAAGADAPMKQVLTAVQGVAADLKALGDRVSKLEAGGATPTGDDDPDMDPDGEGDPTLDADPDGDPANKPVMTGDSAGLAAQFQETLSQAEIIAPGITLPTFDAKAVRKKTVDALCVLRRRALRKALESDDADTIEAVLGAADVSKMTCDAVAPFFNASVAAVKAKRAAVSAATKTHDSRQEPKKDINERNKEFWKNRK